MTKRCSYEGMTPLFSCYNCELFLETCCYVVSYDGYALGAECGDYYLCSSCSNDCIYKTFTNL